MSNEPMSNEPMMDVTSDDKLWAALDIVFAPMVGIIVLLMEDKKVAPFHQIPCCAVNCRQALSFSLSRPSLATVTIGVGGFVSRFCGWSSSIGHTRHTRVKCSKFLLSQTSSKVKAGHKSFVLEKQKAHGNFRKPFLFMINRLLNKRTGYFFRFLRFTNRQ